jgi:hypothetical protein
LKLVEFKLSAVRGLSSICPCGTFLFLLRRNYRWFAKHLTLVNHDVKGLIVLLNTLDASRGFYFFLMIVLFLLRRILLIEDTFHVVLEVFVLEVSYTFSLLALV